MPPEQSRRHDHAPLEVRVRVTYVSGSQGQAVAVAQGAALRALLDALHGAGHPLPADTPPHEGAHSDYGGS